MNLFILFGISSICSTDVIPTETIVALTTSPRKLLDYVAVLPDGECPPPAHPSPTPPPPLHKIHKITPASRKRKLSGGTTSPDDHKFKQTKISTFFSHQQLHKNHRPNVNALAPPPPTPIPLPPTSRRDSVESIVSSCSSSTAAATAGPLVKLRRISTASFDSSSSLTSPPPSIPSAPPLDESSVPFVRLERLSIAKMLERANCTLETNAYYDDCEYDIISTAWIISKLKHLQELNNVVADSNSTAASSSSPTKKKNEYTVERICEINEIDGQPFFRVKWQDYSDKHNTWEPLTNVGDCQALSDYLLQQMQSYQHVIDALIKRLRREYLVSADIRNAANNLEKTIKLLAGFNVQKLQSDLILLAFIPLRRESKSYQTISKRAAHFTRLFPAYFRRAEQLLHLRAFEQRINATDKSSNLSVENVVDYEGAPVDFTYINEIRPGDGVVIPTDPFVGCHCDGPCGYRSKTCCGRNSGSEFAYDCKRRIRVPQGTPVFECNKRCACGPDCGNRVVQQGRTHSLCIFKTANGCGWGVRTLRTIYEGQFICEYVGEIITYEETERRGAAYDAAGRTYLFDLDMNSNDNPYTIDAAHMGNVSHFINHSCAPNCGVWAVWVDCLDMDLPRICLFALRRIAAGEELNFDYLNQSTNVTAAAPSVVTKDEEDDDVDVVESSAADVDGGNDSVEKKEPILNVAAAAAAAATTPKGHRNYGGRKMGGVMECRCQAPNCRKFLF